MTEEVKSEDTAKRKSSPLESLEDKPAPLLKTGWAEDTTEGSFDQDQFDINAWVSAPSDHKMEILVSKMTVADAEELVATCRSAANEHYNRAESALQLGSAIVHRLGLLRDEEKKGDPVNAVPTQLA